MIAYAKPYSFLRHIQRGLHDGSRLVFLRNTSNEDIDFHLMLSGSFKQTYWLDPADGSIFPATGDRPGEVACRLAPYGSVILFAGVREKIPPCFLTHPPVLAQFPLAHLLQKLELWNIQAGSVSLTNTPLFEWRSHPQLRYSSEVGAYTATFKLAETEPGKHYFLDLGQVFFTADVSIKGKEAGSLLFAPYRLDVTPYLQAGANRIEVKVTPTQRNGFIGRALAGNKAYKRFRDKAHTSMPAGMVGPARLLMLDASLAASGKRPNAVQ